MKIINRIQIKYFRSFANKKVEIFNLKDVNVFSGANDAGKSNILRALNLFFNNEITHGTPFNIERDLSKLQIERSAKQAKERRTKEKRARQKDLWVKIKLHFRKDSAGMLPKRFFVEYSWDKNGLNPRRNSNIKTGYRKEKGELSKNQENALEGQLTQFLNDFSFEYVPAIKDRNYIRYLFQKLQNSLFKKNVGFKNQSEEFNRILGEETDILFTGFEKRSGIKANFKVPDTLLDFFRTLDIDTEKEISLFERGDGIQMQFIPELLEEIGRNAKSEKIVWGFEEPENCYEPLKAFQVAQQFLKYANEKQIFITTHSFPFISLCGDSVSSYRVRKEKGESKVGNIDWVKRTIKGEGFENDADEIEKELGLLKTYEQLSKHLGIEQNKQEKQNHLYVEDKNTEIYKISWLKVNGCSVNENFSNVFDEKAPFVIYPQGNRSELKKFLDLERIDNQKSKKIIGLFDFDDGYNDFKALNPTRWNKIIGMEKNCLQRKRKSHKKFYALTIPVLKNRENYAKRSNSHNYLILEHLFTDDVLRKMNCFGGMKEVGGGGKITKIKGKRKLWKQLIELPENDFKNFKPLFNKINRLFQN